MEDNVSWLPHSNNCLCILKHLLNHICITEALNRPQKPVSCLSAGLAAEPSTIPCVNYFSRHASGLKIDWQSMFRLDIECLFFQPVYLLRCQNIKEFFNIFFLPSLPSLGLNISLHIHNSWVMLIIIIIFVFHFI